YLRVRITACWSLFSGSNSTLPLPSGGSPGPLTNVVNSGGLKGSSPRGIQSCRLLGVTRISQTSFAPMHVPLQGFSPGQHWDVGTHRPPHRFWFLPQPQRLVFLSQ